MEATNYTSTEQALAAFDGVTSYFERYVSTVEIEDQEPRASNWCYCLSCSTFVENESHQCSEVA